MQPGGPVTHIVKSGKHRRSEPFDQEKLYKSLVAACLAAGAPTGHAETLARRTTEQVAVWVQSRPEVTSNDLRRTAATYLKIYHPDASYLYEHHRSTL